MKRASILLLATLLSWSGFAQTNAIPGVSAPAGFDEGIATRLTPEQLAQIEPWAKNGKADLIHLMGTLNHLSVADQKDRLFRNIRDVVIASAPKNTETLMRYVLNRGLKIYQVLEEESPNGSIGLIDQQVRVLKLSVDFALRYYESDMAFLTGKGATPSVELPFAKFGQEYAAFLMNLSESILDVSAQYRIELMAQGFLAWDLYRDKDQIKHAPVIHRLNSFYGSLPERSDQDSVAVAQLREIRRAYQSALKTLRGEVTDSNTSTAVKNLSDSLISLTEIRQLTALASKVESCPDRNKLIEDFIFKNHDRIETYEQLSTLFSGLKECKAVFVQFVPTDNGLGYDDYNTIHDSRSPIIYRVLMSYLQSHPSSLSAAQLINLTTLMDNYYHAQDNNEILRLFAYANLSQLSATNVTEILNALRKDGRSLSVRGYRRADVASGILRAYFINADVQLPTQDAVALAKKYKDFVRPSETLRSYFSARLKRITDSDVNLIIGALSGDSYTKDSILEEWTKFKFGK